MFFFVLLQVNERQISGDGFMLNFLTVMQLLASKVKLDKIDTMYFHHPKSRLEIKEETRLKMTTQESEDWINGIGM